MIEKENYERELQLSKRKIVDLQDAVETRDKVLFFHSYYSNSFHSKLKICQNHLVIH